MENYFQKLMSKLSKEELQEYLDNRASYVPDAVESAIAEIQKRGRTFSDDEHEIFKRELQQERAKTEKKETEKEDQGFWDFSKRLKENIVTDETAPAYYSERDIYFLTLLFNAVFGSILLAINFRKTLTKKGVWEVVTFGIVYTGLQIWLLSLIPGNTLFVWMFNFVGAVILNSFFWEKYIGKDTKYRKKPIWVPVIIAIVITVSLVLEIIYSRAVN
jgi:hypothetical protein